MHYISNVLLVLFSLSIVLPLTHLIYTVIIFPIMDLYFLIIYLCTIDFHSTN